MKAGEEEIVVPTAPAPAPSTDLKMQRGIGSRILGLIGSLFSRGNKNDFEKKLQHLSKEEVTVHTRLKRRMQRWRKLARVMIIYTVVGEGLALGFAILSNRTADLPWKVRAIRALPVFALPVIFALLYSTCAGYHRMMEQKDNDRLERLKAERQEKINELKERTNYYITQQLIQQYDPDPAAKAAAASILASKLGAESGLKLALAAGLTTTEDLDSQRKSQAALNQPGDRVDGDVMHPKGLRNRRSQHRSQVAGLASSYGMPQMEAFSGENNMSEDTGRAAEVWEEQGTDVRELPRSPANGGWIAKLAAMLVGEDPTQCYALICKRCHAHNGLAKKEDQKYIQYYCPHCQTLNGMQSTGDGLSLTDEPAETSPEPKETKATSFVDGERPDISDSAGPALISQIISGELDHAHSSNESS